MTDKNCERERRKRHEMELRSVRFGYVKGNPLIADLSISFEKETVTTLIGPNGCGKSTVLKLLAGMLKPEAGTAEIRGSNIRRIPARARAKQLAYLMQSPRPPAMTVRQLVECGRFPYRGTAKGNREEDEAAIAAALEATDMAKSAQRSLASLSGGQRQRAFIAMALAQDTDILLLDEPTTYLDVGAAHDIMALVRNLRENGKKTVVQVVHDPDLAMRYSDRIVVMERGCATCVGDPGAREVLDAASRAFQIPIERAQCTSGSVFAAFPPNMTAR